MRAEASYSLDMGGPRGTSERRNTLPPIIPRPRHAHRDPGHLSLDGGVLIRVAESARSASTATVQRLQAGLEAHRISRPRVVSGRSSRSQGCAVELTIDPEVGELRHLDSCHDVYRLLITPDGAALSSPSAAGLRYAAETLLQLIGPDGRLPCCTIEDGADLELRGLMLDISRGKVPTRESLEDLIDTCAALKLNLLMLYTEHTFRFKKHPLIGRGDSPLSARTLSALDAYAADRFVDLVPCLQSLGHMEHILKLPRYRAMAETDQG